MGGLNRRRFFQGIAAAMAGGPLLSALGRSVAHAEDGDVPPRLLLIYSPHGTSYPHWRPRPVGDDFDLEFEDSILAPLAPLKEKICVLDGLDVLSAYRASQSGHEGGMAALFTGGSRVQGGAVDSASHVSIDQSIAQHLGATTGPYANESLAFHVGELDGTFGYMTSAFFRDVGGEILPNPTEVYSRAVFDRLFSDVVDGSGPSPEQVAALERKKSVLDVSRGQVQALRDSLGAIERQKLDNHLDAIADLEARLELGAAVCAAPTFDLRSPGEARGPDVLPQRVDEFSRITTAALACRLTPVVGLQLMHSGYAQPMPNLGIDYDLHNGLAHSAIAMGEVVDGPYRDDYLAMQRWVSEQVASLLLQMDAIVEENGKTLLDNTVVCWANDMGDPALHSNVDIPVVLAGGAGRIPMGRFLEFEHSQGNHNQHIDGQGEAPHNQLLVSLSRAFGMDTNVVGDPSYVGELPGLLG